MLVTGDLGFSSLVLLVCLVFPVIGLVIRRKWKIASARKEEIRRLLILASEESARAELEATFSYGSVHSVPQNSYQCAVCYCPTTTRCARCKSVRYCSGKCQIIHWRKGHKEECRPPSATFYNSDDGSDSFPKLAKQSQHDLYNDSYEMLSVETLSAQPSWPGSSCSSEEVVNVKNNDIKVDSIADTERASNISESSSTSFSGFSTTPSGSESSDDASVVESINSKEPEGSDGQAFTDVCPDVIDSNFKKVVETKTLSPKFASLVDSINSFSKLNQSKADNSNSESAFATVGSPAQSTGVTLESAIARPAAVSSGFWDRTVASVSSNDAQDDAAHNSIGENDGQMSDSESFLHFKFNLSGSNATLHTKSSQETSRISDELPAALGNSRPVDRVAVSDNTHVKAPSNSSSPSVSCERLYHSHNDFTAKSEVSTSSEFESSSLSSSTTYKDLLSTDASKIGRFSSFSSKKPNNETVSTLRLSKPGMSTAASQSSSASHTTDRVPSEKFKRADNVETISSPSSQLTSSPPTSIGGLKFSVQKVVDQFKGPKSGRYGDKGLFPYDLFVKLYTTNKVELRPCGLINCGNSCYANAIIQCLTFTPPLTAYFVQGLHSKACLKKEWCFTCEFESLILREKESKSPLSPAGILSQLQNIGSQLSNGREEDAHEFLRYAIDTMQSICLKEAGVNASGSLEEETTLIGLTFGGYLRSKIKCMKCHHKSERQERMMDLTVEIEGDIERLEDALKRFTGTEILDGDNKYQCSSCKSYEKAKKKLTILEAPNVLTIALKRFQSGKFGKLNKSIRFPEILNLAPYMSGTSDKLPIYRLYGVIVHLDVMNAAFSGHYVCYVKNTQNRWFKVDDSTVTPVELERVLTKGAYILLYARCSPRASRLLRNDPSRINGKKTTSKLKSTSACPTVVQLHPNSVLPENMASVESFYLKFHRLQRILEEDSSSDSFSFTSSNSDEGSCSTDSTRDSTSTDDLSEYIFGGGGGWNSPWNSDTSSSTSSSPLNPSHSHGADLDGNTLNPLERGRHQGDHVGSRKEDDIWDELSGRNLEGGKGREPFLHSDTSKQCIKLGGSSSYRETDSDRGRLGEVNPSNDVKCRVSFRRSVSERTD